MRKTHGFTLIELSIVLVIIGLIVGGVLVGRDLIAASQIRAQVSQFEKFNQAVNTFRGKYNCLPGDCPNISSFLTNVGSYLCPYSACGNGDGNGVITESFNGVASPGNVSGFPYEVAGEPIAFWEHMYVAGLTECCGSSSTSLTIGLSFPRDKVGGLGISAGTLQGRNGYFWGITTANIIFGANYYDYLNLSAATGVAAPGIAQKLDAKMDDGSPITGNVYAAAVQAPGDFLVHPQTSASAPASSSCITSATPPAYNISYGSTACSLWINMN